MVASCFLRLYYLERACKIQVQAAAHGKLNLPQKAAVDMMQATFSNAKNWEGLAATAWPALLRQAERLDPGYKA